MAPPGPPPAVAPQGLPGAPQAPPPGPPPAGAPQGPAAGLPQQPPAGGPGAEDPHGIAAAVGRLGYIDRRSAKVPVAILSAVLHDGDVVELLAHGRFRGHSAVGALVGSAVVLVSDRQWKADVVRIELAPGLQVQGWQDDRAATLTFVGPGQPVALEGINDRALAVEIAQRARDRIAGLGTPPGAVDDEPPTGGP